MNQIRSEICCVDLIIIIINNDVFEQKGLDGHRS